MGTLRNLLGWLVRQEAGGAEELAHLRALKERITVTEAIHRAIEIYVGG